MSRRGKIIDKIYLLKYHLEIPVRLIKDDGSYGSGKVWFEAELGGTTFKNADYNVIEKEVKAHADVLFIAEWKPVIEIKTEAVPDEEQRTAMEFSFKRFYYSKVAGVWRELDWDDYQDAVNPEIAYRKESDLIGRSNVWRDASGETGFPDDDVDVAQKHFVDYTKKKRTEKTVEYKTGTYYRPYTEELWNGLCQLRDMVARASMRLAEILGSDEGQARIAKGATLLMLTEDAGKKS